MLRTSTLAARILARRFLDVEISDTQSPHGLSVDAQRDRMVELAVRRGWWLVYSETGTDGSTRLGFAYKRSGRLRAQLSRRTR